jgi:hypothetical protein
MSHRDPIDALHAALLATPGGIAGAAPVVGRSPGHLHNKFSDAMPHYEVTAREAIALAKYAKSTAYVEALCEAFGGVFLAVPAGAPSDDDVLQSYLDIIQRMGELSREFTEARADGVIEPAEFDAMKLRANRTVSSIMHMMRELEGMVRELPVQSSVSLKRVS